MFGPFGLGQHLHRQLPLTVHPTAVFLSFPFSRMGLPKPIIRLVAIAAIVCAYLAFDFYSEVQAAEANQRSSAESFFSARKHASQGHTNNWAVLVCSSRYWFNYRVSCGLNGVLDGC